MESAAVPLVINNISQQSEGVSSNQLSRTTDIIYLCLQILSAGMGISGNILVILSIIMYEPLRRSCNVFICNLSIADLLITGLVTPAGILGYLSEEMLMSKVGICEIIGALCYIACTTSLLTLMVISINRLIAICYHGIYKQYFSPAVCVAICLSVWLFNTVTNMSSYLRNDGFWLEPRSMHCLWNFYVVPTHKYLFALLIIMMPLVVTAICYTHIFLYVRRSRKRVTDAVRPWKKDSKKAATEMAKTLFLVTAFFTCSWGPLFIDCLFDHRHDWSTGFFLFAIYLAHLNSATNPVIYGATNTHFRNGFKKVLRMKVKDDAPETSANTKDSTALATVSAITNYQSVSKTC